MSKPVWNRRRGIKLIRYGGLSPVRQDNGAAPVDHGLWAFVFPYFDTFFLTGRFSRDKWELAEDGGLKSPRKELRRTFWHRGDLFTRFAIPGSCEWERGNGWSLTSDRELFEFIHDSAPANFQFAAKCWGGSFLPNRTNPYQRPNNISVDCLEVFVPKFPIRRSR